MINWSDDQRPGDNAAQCKREARGTRMQPKHSVVPQEICLFQFGEQFSKANALYG